MSCDAIKLPFKDNSLEIVHSSAVIEHVGSYENQLAMLKECSRVSKNFLLINNEFSNYEICKKAKRVVTCWGTSHLEYAAFGMKAIIIREGQLSAVDKKSIIKPNSVVKYKSKIKTKNNNEFKLKQKK